MSWALSMTPWRLLYGPQEGHGGAAGSTQLLAPTASAATMGTATSLLGGRTRPRTLVNMSLPLSRALGRSTQRVIYNL
jgi:hypothetical protein